MTQTWKLIAAAACVAALLSGCSVRVDADGHSTGVEVRGPNIHVSVPESEPGQTGFVPVDLALPGGAGALEIRLGSVLGRTRLDGSGSAALNGQIGYYRTAPKVESRLSGDRFVIDVPAEKANNVGNARIPDTVLHVGARVPVSLTIGAGVGNLSLDLRDLTVTRVAIGAMVGDTEIQVAKDANVRLRYKVGIGRNNLRDAGFVQNGETWLSPGFKESNVVEISVDAGIGQFTIDR